MVRTFYVQKGKEDIMHKFNKEHSKKTKDGSNK